MSYDEDGQFVSEDEARKMGRSEVELWLEKIRLAQAEEQTWLKAARQAATVYEAEEGKRSFNIFHANTEVLVPALYNSTPIPDVRSRYGGNQQDEQQAMPEMAGMEMMAAQVPAPAPDPGREISELTERALSYITDTEPFDQVMEDAVRDGAVTGRAVVRLRYSGQVSGDMIESQRVWLENVPFDRFVRGPGLNWRQVDWIAFRHDLDRDQVERLTGSAARLKRLGFDDGAGNGEDDETPLRDKQITRTIKVYEVWCRRKRQVIFLTDRDRRQPLAVHDDPLGLPGFFPIPQPLQFVRRLRSLTPVCPYDIYRPLIEEIDQITRRIARLTDQLRVRGLYDPKLAPDFERLQYAEDGTYLPCSDADQFIQGATGGLERAVLHWPNDVLVGVIATLYEQREQVKQSIYEVMGISDILRGQVDPREKATQSQIKEASGARRLQRNQKEVARLARDLFRMMADVIHRNFEPHVLAQMTGIEPSQEALELMRSGADQYQVDIETDSTVRADQSRYQEELSQFLMGTAQITQAVAQMAPIMPQSVGPMVQIFGEFARKFNLGKQGEEALDRLAESAKQPPVMAEQSQADPPEPEPDEEALAMQKAMAEAELEKQRLDLEKTKLDLEKIRLANQNQILQADIEVQKGNLDLEGRALDNELKRAKIEQARQMKRESKANGNGREQSKAV